MKKPTATGSAGRCEPEAGRLTDPDSFSCSFFTPYLHCLMFRQCGLPLALSKPTLGVEDNFVFHRGHPALPCAAFAGPPRPAFSFLPFFCPFVLPPCVEGLVFSHPGSPVPRIRPQLAHTPSTGRVCCFAGVVPLPGSQNRTQALTGPSLVFTVFFSHLFSSVIPLVAAPGDNSTPREWEGSYKAASRFSQCRPMSTPLSAAFR